MLARTGQPAQYGFVELEAVIGQTSAIEVNYRERRQHKRVLRQIGNFSCPKSLTQVGSFAFLLVGLAGIAASAPTLNEKVDGIAIEFIDPDIREIIGPGFPGERLRPCGNYDAALWILACGFVEKVRHAFAAVFARRLVQSIQQKNCVFLA